MEITENRLPAMALQMADSGSATAGKDPQAVAKRMHGICALIFGALTAAATYGAVSLGVTSVVALPLIGLTLMFSHGAILAALQFLKPDIGLLSSLQKPEHHDLDRRVVDNPSVIQMRMQKALADAAHYVDSGYNANFDKVFAKPLPPDASKPSCAIDSKEFIIEGRRGAIAHTQGLRNEMEDRDVASSITFTYGSKTETARIFGVFDGHGGDQASEFVAANIHSYLKQNLSRYCEDGITDAAVYQALRNTFLELDNAFLNAAPENRHQAGTTACVAVVINGDLYVANTGDARAVLYNGNSPIPFMGCRVQQLTKDHKPGLMDMRKAIKKRGGAVINRGGQRVNGILGVARAIGDWEICDLLQRRYKVISPLPKVCKIAKKDLSSNAMLVIACDGLWDVASSRQVGQAVQKGKSSTATPQEIAARLTQAALDAGSTDNISVMVVGL